MLYHCMRHISLIWIIETCIWCLRFMINANSTVTPVWTHMKKRKCPSKAHKALHISIFLPSCFKKYYAFVYLRTNPSKITAVAKPYKKYFLSRFISIIATMLFIIQTYSSKSWYRSGHWNAYLYLPAQFRGFLPSWCSKDFKSAMELDVFRSSVTWSTATKQISFLIIKKHILISYLALQDTCKMVQSAFLSGPSPKCSILRKRCF